MTRKLQQKPAIEVIKDPKSAIEVTIYYDRKEKEFFADVLGPAARYHDGNLDTVVKLVRDHLAASRGFEWKPVIVIAHSGGPGGVDRSHGVARYQSDGACLSFEFWRCELAKKPGTVRKGEGASFVQRPHLADVEDPKAPSWRRVDRERGGDVHEHYKHAGEEVIPYTEEGWATLHHLKEATERAYGQLKVLFSKPDLLLKGLGAAERLLEMSKK